MTASLPLLALVQNLNLPRSEASLGMLGAISACSWFVVSAGTSSARNGVGRAAVFAVTGDPGAAYSISLPVDGAVVLTGPGADMPVNGFTSSPSSSGVLNGTGQQVLQIGATLTVGANQAPGTYGGSFELIVNYQ